MKTEPVPTSPTRPDRAERAFSVLLIVLFAAVTAYTITKHEPWRDEADSWLVARDASLIDLFQLTGHMGTPALWYLVLMPFAKLGVPYAAMYVINWCFAVAAVAMLLMASPLPVALKVLLAGSYTFAYEYAVIARPYAMTMCLLFALASLWQMRFTKPIRFALVLCLLASSTVFGLLMAAAVGGLYLLDALDARFFPDLNSRRIQFAIAVMLAGGMIAAAQLIPIGPTQLPSWTLHRWPGRMQIAMGEMYGPNDGFTQLLDHIAEIESLIGVPDLLRLNSLPQLLTRAAFGLAILAWLRTPRIILLYLIPMFGMAYIFEYQWYGGPRHAGLMLVYFVFSAWVWGEERLSNGQPDGATTEGSPPPDIADAKAQSRARVNRTLKVFERAFSFSAIALGIGLFASVLTTVYWVKWDIANQYSHSTQIARYLDDHGYGDPSKWNIASTFAAESVLMQLRHRNTFWYADLRMDGSHNTWDANYIRASRATLGELIERVRNHFPGDDHVLFLSLAPIDESQSQGLERLYRTEGKLGPSWEEFFLYRVLPSPPTTSAALPE